MTLKPVARMGDLHSCPVKGHGVTPIVSGASGALCEGRPTACVGDKTGCGATIVEGSSVSDIEGRPVAYLGAKTSHGGTIISGATNATVQT